MPNNNDNNNANRPSISSVNYDASNGVLTLTGSNFSTSSQDYVITDLSIKGNGEGNNRHTLSSNSTIIGTPLSTSFSIQLSLNDQLAISQLFGNGNQGNNGGQLYLSAADNWDTVASSAVDWKNISVNNNNAPSLSSVSYDAATGQLTLSGNNLTTSASDYQATDLTFTCNGNHYTVTGGNVSAPPTSNNVTLQLSATDQSQLETFFNQNGNQDANGNAYQLVANAGWDNGASNSTQTVEVNSVKQSIATNVYTDELRVDGNNNTYYHDTNDNCIHKIDSQTNQKTTAYQFANGEHCNGSVVGDDSGNLYFHSSGSSDGDCIKKIDATNHSVTIIAKLANGEQCNGDVANDHNGNKYFHSTGSSDGNCIKKIDATDNHVSSVATLANGEQCNGSIVSDDSNNLYFNSTGSSDGNCIKKIDATNNNVTTIAKFSSDVNCNNLIVDHNGNLYFNDSGNNCIKEIDANSNQVNTLVTGIQCSHLERDSSGNIYFNNSGDNTIKEISSGDHHVTTLATNINGDHFTIDNHGKLLINDSSNHEIKVCDTSTSTPTANTVTASGNADSTLSISLSGNDTNGTLASFKVVVVPANGTLYTDAALTHALVAGALISASNNAATLYFKPNGDWNGSTSFQYNAIDDKGLQSASAATASITINAVDADITASAVSVSGNADSTLTVQLSGADTDGSIASFKVPALPANGTLYTDAALTHALVAGALISASNNAATLYFKPNGDWNGSTSFQYNAIDDKGLQSASAATASIAVNAADAGITVNSQSLNGNQDVPMRITLAGSDDDGSVTSFKVTSLCDHGTLYTNANMTIEVRTDTIIVASGNSATLYFKPSSNWTGNTAFSYVGVDDQGLHSAASATTNIAIAGPDDVPTANNITINATEDTVLTVTLSGQDIDGNIASFKVSNLPSTGTLYTDSSFQHAVQIGTAISAIGNSATLYFKPSLEWNGTTSFQYVALDNDLEQTSAAATATINVSAANDGPSFTIGNGVSGFVKSGPAVVIDNTLRLHDADLALLDNYNGASITLVRDGGASVQDVFSGSGDLSFSGGNVLVSGINIGTVSNLNGRLTINFNNNATQARVDDALASISYANNSFSPPDSVQIDYSFKEGNTALLNASASTSITMSIVSDKGLSGVNYDVSTGKLTLNGTHLTSSAGDYHFIGSTLTGDNGATYTLTANDINSVTPSYGSVTVQLSNTAKQALSGLLDQSGKVAFDGVTAYNLSLLSGWDTNATAISTESVWVSNASTSPSIAGINYDAASGNLTINGANLSTSAGSYHANRLTIYEDESPSLTLSAASNQIVGSPTSRNVTFHLSANDQQTLNGLIMRADSGEDSDSADPYTFSTGAGWTMRGTALTSHNITVTNLPLPSVSAAAYNVTTGLLSLTGTNFSSLSADYLVTDLTLTGDGGTSYTLTKSSVIVGSPTSTGVTVQLSTADQFALDGLFNKNGVQANDGQTTYHLSATAGWDMNASLAASAVVTVSNADSNVPTLSSVNYNAAKGIFTFIGSHLSNHGNSNGLDLTHFSITDGHGGQFNFNTNDVITQQTVNGFAITLTSNEQSSLASLIRVNGNSAYNFNATAKWDSDSGAAISNQAVNVSGAPVPTISGVSYDVNTGLLTVNGNRFTTSTSDYLVNNFTFKGDGGSTYTLTSGSSITRASAQTFVVQLSSTDQFALDGLLNKSGTIAHDGQTHYNLALATGWNVNGPSITTQGLFVSNADINAPKLTGVSYQADTGVFTFTGTHLTVHGNDANSIALANFKLTGGNNGSFNFNATNDAVSNLTTTGFTVKLNYADQSAVNTFVNTNGSHPVNGAAYNITTLATWDSDNGNAINKQALNVSGEDIVHANTIFNVPLTSNTQTVAISTLIENSGQLELSKAVFTAFAGSGASVNVSNFSNANHSTGVNDYLYYDASNGGLYYADHGSAAGSTVTEIAIIGGSQGHPSALSAGDFSLIA